MRFPLRLAATLYSQKFSRGSRSTPILFFSPLINHFGPIPQQEEVTPDFAWQTPEACVAAANRSRACVVWLGHAEPLLHPSIGKVVSALLQAGRYVFLHTSGFGLRKRIHEFQPHPCFFLALEAPNPDIPGISSQAASQLFVEAIFGAGLSGFNRCAHVSVNAQTNAAQTAQLFDSLKAKGLEGFVVSSGCPPKTISDDSAFRRLTEIRNAIPSRGWRNFSLILENSFLTLEQPRLAIPDLAERERFSSSNSVCEESAITP